MPKTAHRRKCRPPGRRRSIVARKSIVGVNKYVADDPQQVDVRDIDNTAVRESQIARLKRVRAAVIEAACQAALQALTEGAKGRRQPVGTVHRGSPGPGHGG